MDSPPTLLHDVRASARPLSRTGAARAGTADRSSSRNRSLSRSRSRSRVLALSEPQRSRRLSEVLQMQHPTTSLEEESEDSEDSQSTAASSLQPVASSSTTSTLLPSPFYPPTLSRVDGLTASYDAPALPSTYPPLPVAGPVEVHDPKDKGTPDEGVMRDGRLVRLTGRWPFNSEAPLPDLFSAGFITPTPLFYVRNHGLVPQVSQLDALNWTIEISGLVANPVSLSLSTLLNPALFTPHTLPITLVCAGNRRKEQNLVSPSLGFSWGAAGLSTALFTGVFLSDILEFVQPRSEGRKGQEGYRRAEYVIFEGEEELAKGKYGTSQKLERARRRDQGMMIVWAMNGQALEPDHGYPVRLVVPGQIGGRSVKWLKKIIVSDQESQHHLHFWDNKVLPQSMTAEEARADPEIWKDPRYIINDLNTNSACAVPAHDSTLILPPASSPEVTYYTLKGYAYAGGGRRVTRVEITLDGGRTWKLANVNYPEDQYRKEPYQGDVWGTIDITERDECFCWVFWELEVDVRELENAKGGAIEVKAMDEGLSGQGKSMYWNPTGMMNNWWFRIAIHKSIDPVTGLTTLRFEHPSMPGSELGGWMQRFKDEGKDLLNPIFTTDSESENQVVKIVEKEVEEKKVSVMINEKVTRKISMKELEEHATKEEPWFVVEGEVYDGTGFLKSHPGGAESITIVAGEDATEDFLAIHSAEAQAKLSEYHIGTLIPSLSTVSKSVVPVDTSSTFLHKSTWKSAQLVSIEYINHDSRVYRFSLDHPDQPLGLPTGQHVYARLRRKAPKAIVNATATADWTGENSTAVTEIVEGDLVQRAYTPVSGHDAKGYLDLLIKVYHRTKDFPNGGRMTIGFEELEVGDRIEFKGPLGSFEWLGKGMARWKGVKRKVANIGMICGGSGITPIIQVLRRVIADVSDDSTKLWLLNANKTPSDILLHSDLLQLEEQVGPSRFQQHFCLSQAPEDWHHSKGRINEEMMRCHLPPPPTLTPGDDGESLILVCGPERMIEEIVKPGLTQLGWDIEKSLVVF